MSASKTKKQICQLLLHLVAVIFGHTGCSTFTADAKLDNRSTLDIFYYRHTSEQTATPKVQCSFTSFHLNDGAEGMFGHINHSSMLGILSKNNFATCSLLLKYNYLSKQRYLEITERHTVFKTIFTQF